MKTILNIVVKLLGSKIGSIISDVLQMLTSFFGYKKESLKKERIENNQKAKEELDKKIDDITKNGSLEDLLSLKKMKG